MKKIFIITSLLFSISNAELITPQNGDRLNYRHVLFEWSQLPSVDAYNLQASNQLNFNNLLLDIYEESTVYIDKDNFDWNGNYFWRVRPILNIASDEEFTYGDWSDVSNFSIGGVLYYPLDVDIYEDNLLEDGFVLST